MRSEPKLNVPFIDRSGSQAYLWAMRLLLVLVALAGVTGLPCDIRLHAETAWHLAQGGADSGTIKPLSEVLDTVKSSVPGQVVDVQLDKTGTPWTYRIRIRNEKGNVVLVVVDAESGMILSTKGNR